MKIYILSPHIDDAAFGLAHTISKASNNNIPVTIINCFTITKWTAIPVDNKEINAVSLLRKNEDAAFYKAISNSISIINLDLLDAPLRDGYIFQNQPFQQNEIDLIGELKNLLEKYVTDGILLCPLAIGNHIDHAICLEAVTKLYDKLPVIFFEDLPYAQRIGEDQIHRHIHKLAKQLRVELRSYACNLENATIDKGKAIRVYHSQLNDEICSEILAHLHVMQGERLWGEVDNIEKLSASLLN